MGVTTVRLPEEMEQELSGLAEERRRSKGWMIVEALREYLEKEALEKKKWQETLGAMESAARGEVVAAEKVHEYLRSWGSEEELSPPEKEILP